MNEPEIFSTKEVTEYRSKIGHFMMHIMSHDGIFKTLNIKPGGEFTVELRINGVQVPVRPFIEHIYIYQQFDERVAKAAQEQFKERLCDLDEMLHKLKDGVETAAREAFPEFKDEEY